MAMEYFCCFHSYRKKTRNLSDSELGRLFRALMLYSETGEKAQLNGREETAFDFIADDIDAAKERYGQKCQTNRENRAKGTSTNDDDRERPWTAVDDRPRTAPNKNKKQKENIYTATAASARARESESSADSLHDDDLVACVVCYEENIGAIPRYVADSIGSWLQNLPAELICKAITEAAATNVRNWKYAESILKRCEASNITSVAAYEAENARKGPAKDSEGKRSPASEARQKLRQIAGGAIDEN